MQQEQEEAPQEPKESKLVHYSALAAVILISILIYYCSSNIESFKTWGYAGAFLLPLLANATIFLPAPGWLFVVAMSSSLNIWLLAFVAGIGGGIGEITGYLAGFGGERFLQKKEGKKYAQVKGFMQKYGFFALLALAAAPIGIFDLAGVIAGATRYKLWKFLLASILGNMLKFFIIAYLSVHLPGMIHSLL
ncbi:SNARE associated Golgi protein [Candidatus Gugararchaeum adminiculabundum]|nr:SNARE associated Golgi protein [Candidatus Gugararchaeum adminiculabundum]